MSINLRVLNRVWEESALEPRSLGSVLFISSGDQIENFVD